MSSGMWQYIALGIVMAGVVIWILVKLFGKNSKNRSSCCGCSLSDACTSAGKGRERKKRDCCESEPTK